MVRLEYHERQAQVYAAKSARMAGRRDEPEGVKAAVKTAISYMIETTAKGWKRKDDEEAMKEVNQHAGIDR